MSIPNPKTIESHWACARCWIKGDDVDSVDVVPQSTVTAIIELLANNPTAYAQDILEVIQTTPDMHRRAGTFASHRADPVDLTEAETDRVRHVLQPEPERACPATHDSEEDSR